MPWGAIAASVVGGMMSSNAAGSAAGTQAASARDATAAQERMFNKQIELQKPFREGGVAAQNRLMQLLGLGGAPTSITAEQARAQLLPEYTKTTTDPGTYGQWEDGGQYEYRGGSTKQSIDEQGLSAAIQNMLAGSAQPQGEDYGSLMRDFTMADYQADPGYAFRQQEGMKGIEGGAAARGGLLSGGALKAIQKYGQDLASQEYGNAFNRFTGQQTNKYNKLAGMVNTGQGATNQLTNAAGQFGSNQASNIIGAGNAQAAGQVGSANAWNQAIGQGVNAYQQNQLMDLIRRPQTSGYGTFPSMNSYGTSYGE